MQTGKAKFASKSGVFWYLRMHWHIQFWLPSVLFWTAWKTGRISPKAWQDKGRERNVFTTFSHLHTVSQLLSQDQTWICLINGGTKHAEHYNHWVEEEGGFKRECVFVSPPHRAGKQSVVVTQAHAHHPLLFEKKNQQNKKKNKQTEEVM